MTAAVLYGSENLKIESVDIPRLAADEALIRVKVALTCGTDLKVWKRGYHARMITPPAVFGHELAGVVETLGVRREWRTEGRRTRGSLELRAVQRLPVLPQGAEQSLRGSAVQQRSLRGIYSHPRAHRSPEHAGDSRARFVSGCGDGRAAGLRACAGFTKPAFSRVTPPW